MRIQALPLFCLLTATAWCASVLSVAVIVHREYTTVAATISV
jgi:hypothetical protein